MSYQLPPDLDHRVKSFVATGCYQSEDEVLRDAFDALDERQSHIAAIQKGIDDEAAGRVRPADEVLDLIEKSRQTSGGS